jgi:hypothetical protein
MKKKKVPLRTCIVCHKTLSKREMIRVVRTPEGVVELDPTGKKNGRGAYICGRMEGFERARKTKAFERALKVQLAAGDYDRLREQFEQIAPRYAEFRCGEETGDES